MFPCTAAALRIGGKVALQRGLAKQTTISTIASTGTNHTLLAALQSPKCAPTTQIRTFSENATQFDTYSRVRSLTGDLISIDTKQLKTLDSDIVRKIHEELMEADVNADGRINSEELKKLLRKHHSAFSDSDIVEIGEVS